MNIVLSGFDLMLLMVFVVAMAIVFGSIIVGKIMYNVGKRPAMQGAAILIDAMILSLLGFIMYFKF